MLNKKKIILVIIIIILSVYVLYKSFNNTENFRNNVMAEDFIFEPSSLKPEDFTKNVQLLKPNNNVVTLNSPMIAVSYFYIEIPKGKIFNSWEILKNNNKADLLYQNQI